MMTYLYEYNMLGGGGVVGQSRNELYIYVHGVHGVGGGMDTIAIDCIHVHRRGDGHTSN